MINGEMVIMRNAVFEDVGNTAVSFFFGIVLVSKVEILT